MIALVALLATAAAEAACTVVAGATVHTAEGPQKGRTVVVADGRVAAVGVGLDGLKLELDDRRQVVGATYRGESCTFVQGTGKQLTAGLVAVPTRLGLVEIGLEPSTRDDNAGTEGDPIRASLVVADAYDPRVSAIAVNRRGGITTALITPGGGLVAGQAGLVRLAGARQAEAVLDRSALMVASVEGPSFAEQLRQLRELVEEVTQWARDRRSWDRGRPFPDGLSLLDLEALVPVVRGQQPLLVYADRASEIEALLRFADDAGIRLILGGAAEGWRLADALADADVPVIVDPLVYGPGGFDQRAGRPDAPKLLAEAGVDVILTGNYGSAHNVRVLRQAAGNAVRAGMPHAAALRSITEVPARVLGLSDRGRVAPGQRADLALWSGDPLELSTTLDLLWIDGEVAPLRSRQTALTRKYMERFPPLPEVLPPAPADPGE